MYYWWRGDDSEVDQGLACCRRHIDDGGGAKQCTLWTLQSVVTAKQMYDFLAI